MLNSSPCNQLTHSKIVFSNLHSHNLNIVVETSNFSDDDKRGSCNVYSVSSLKLYLELLIYDTLYIKIIGLARDIINHN